MTLDWNPPNLYLKINGETDMGLCYVVDLNNNELNYVFPTASVLEVDAKIIIEGESL